VKQERAVSTRWDEEIPVSFGEAVSTAPQRDEQIARLRKLQSLLYHPDTWSLAPLAVFVEEIVKLREIELTARKHHGH
jgi:hypothetical protein